MESRILLLAVKGRDAEVIEQLLAKVGHESVICDTCRELAREGDRGERLGERPSRARVDHDHFVAGQLRHRHEGL
mgnify:CR=1 FL=1